MALDYPERFPGWSDWTPWAGIGVLAVMVGIAVMCAHRRPAVTLAAAWWLASFFVVSHLLVPTWTYRELRLAYPLVAAAALAAGAAAARATLRNRATPVAAAAIAATAVALVFLRNAEMTSDMALAEADVRHRPLAASAQVKLGDMLDLANRTEEAARAYARATVLAPWSYQAWYQLAQFYDRAGRRDEARRAYERAVAVDPSFPFALTRLAVLDLDAGDLAGAERRLAAAERADPDDPYVQYNLAVLDDRRGRRAAARARLERLVARRPEFRLARDGLAQLRGD
jgi:tetratricopeptide (TPR) repeat protein